MKVKLLNNGGYQGMSKLDYSTVFTASKLDDATVMITGEQLGRAGAVIGQGGFTAAMQYPFDKCEFRVIEDLT